MGDVVDLFPAKGLRAVPSVEALAARCGDDISEDWARFARNNRLNDYFLSCVPLWALPQLNYLSDLNAVATVEAKLGLSPIVNAPGTSAASKLGWVAGFDTKDVRVETPVLMCEAYARCFNILLFLKLSRELTNHGLN